MATSPTSSPSSSVRSAQDESSHNEASSAAEIGLETPIYESDLLQDAQGMDWLDEHTTPSPEVSPRRLEGSTHKESCLTGASPISSTRSSANFHLRQRKLFSAEGDQIFDKETLLCPHGVVGNVRPKEEDEFTEEGMERGYQEVLEIFPSPLPEHTAVDVVRRRAATLPNFCSTCDSWVLPTYRCRNCGVLMIGRLLQEHESTCGPI